MPKYHPNSDAAKARDNLKRAGVYMIVAIALYGFDYFFLSSPNNEHTKAKNCVSSSAPSLKIHD